MRGDMLDEIEKALSKSPSKISSWKKDTSSTEEHDIERRIEKLSNPDDEIKKAAIQKRLDAKPERRNADYIPTILVKPDTQDKKISLKELTYVL